MNRSRTDISETDHAQQSRSAARKEIFDQQTWECEDMYEDALWLLYTVRDELLPQREHDWGAEDKEILERCEC